MIGCYVFSIGKNGGQNVEQISEIFLEKIVKKLWEKLCKYFRKKLILNYFILHSKGIEATFVRFRNLLEPSFD